MASALGQRALVDEVGDFEPARVRASELVELLLEDDVVARAGAVDEGVLGLVGLVGERGDDAPGGRLVGMVWG